MLQQLCVLMAFQLAGDAVANGLGLTFPGSLVGMLLLLAWLRLRGGPNQELASVAGAFIDNLGLLFVPAGASVIGFSALIAQHGLALGAALVVSTGVAILVTGLISAPRRPVATRQMQDP